MSLVGRALGVSASGLLVAAAVATALLGHVAHVWSGDQLTQRNDLAAQAMAEQLAQRHPAPTATLSAAEMRSLAEPISNQGAQVIVVAQDGHTLLDLPAAGDLAGPPAWLMSAWPLKARDGVAPVRAPDGQVLQVSVVHAPAAAWRRLLQLIAGTFATLLALGALALLVQGLLLRRLHRPFAALVSQAQALEQGSLVQQDLPPQAELVPLARSLNGIAARLRAALEAQADQVAMLQRQAQLDIITGLPLRDHFLAQFHQRLAEIGAHGVALLLLRLPNLDDLNARLGHAAIDQLLSSIADVVLTYLDRIPGTFGGRLNGSDIALCLPVEGVALETAMSLHATLAALPAMRNTGAHAVVGGADGLRDVKSSEALAVADAALAMAEAQAERHGQLDSTTPLHDNVKLKIHAPSQASEPGVVVIQQGDQRAVTGGARTWREQISVALAEGRVRLTEFKVVDSTGRVLRLECPLRVQLIPGGDYQAAARWLALARRSRLLPRVDLAAIELALTEIRRDGMARAVHSSLQSLEAPGYIDEVSAVLQTMPQEAAQLSIEIVEGTGPSTRGPLAIAAAAWQRHGTQVGIEHAGASPQQLPDLQSAGAAYVKVSSRHVRGAATEEAVNGYARSLVALIHGLGQKAIAEGVEDARDLDALWAIGFDGATGPAVGSLS